jgi:hypothetical protein
MSREASSEAHLRYFLAISLKYGEMNSGIVIKMPPHRLANCSFMLKENGAGEKAFQHQGQV